MTVALACRGIKVYITKLYVHKFTETIKVLGKINFKYLYFKLTVIISVVVSLNL